MKCHISNDRLSVSNNNRVGYISFSRSSYDISVFIMTRYDEHHMFLIATFFNDDILRSVHSIDLSLWDHILRRCLIAQVYKSRRHTNEELKGFICHEIAIMPKVTNGAKLQEWIVCESKNLGDKIFTIKID